MQEAVRKAEQELNTLRAETAKLSGQRDSLAQVTKDLESRRQSAAADIGGMSLASLKVLSGWQRRD